MGGSSHTVHGWKDIHFNPGNEHALHFPENGKCRRTYREVYDACGQWSGVCIKLNGIQFVCYAESEDFTIHLEKLDGMGWWYVSRITKA